MTRRGFLEKHELAMERKTWRPRFQFVPLRLALDRRGKVFRTLRLITLIYPFGDGIISGVRAKEISGVAHGLTGIELRKGRAWRDRLAYSWSDGRPETLERGGRV